MNIEAPLDSETSFIALANTLGHSVLIETLRMASYFISHSNGVTNHYRVTRLYFNEAKSCYYFVQGTGLQSIIDRFGMAYNADSIRDGFNYYIRKSI